MGCIFCDMIHQEVGSEKRVVLDTPNFLAFCPFAALMDSSARRSDNTEAVSGDSCGRQRPIKLLPGARVPCGAGGDSARLQMPLFQAEHRRKPRQET
jgi:hypothetical protein